MQRRLFGPTASLVPVIGQGTWQIEDADRRAMIAALQRGIELGATHIDTAEMYGDGESERIVGEAIRGRRDDVFLVSKVLPGNASVSGTIAACERSLVALETDHLDCYLLHWRGSHPLEQTIAAFQTLQKTGKIRSWGVSNFDATDLAEALAIAGPGQIACNQVLYHLAERSIEHRVVPWCARNGVAVVGYSPFGHGRFPATQTAGGKVLASIGESHGATPRQVALAYITRVPSLFTIPKASHIARVQENAGAGTMVLTPEEITLIDRAFPLGRDTGHLPML